MTSDQHTDHISNGQRVSRPSLPTLLYFLFYSKHFNDFIGVRECSGISPPHIFFNSILAHRTSGTFGFARHSSPTLRKTKRAIFCQRTYNDNDDIKLNLAENKTINIKTE